MKPGIRRFFDYARERQSIHLKKTAGEPRPWTRDEILSYYRFCCVFREDDRTTRWLREHVRDPLRETAEVVPAVVLFRMFNRISVGEAVWCQTDIEHESSFAHYMETMDKRVLRRAIRALIPDGPYVTGSYIIAGPPGKSKLDGMLEIVHNFVKSREWQFWADGDPVGNECTLQATWEWLREWPFFGDFHSYEIVTDLRHTRFLESAPDIMTWANPGPGANRGANRVLGRDTDQRNSKEKLNDDMRFILECSRGADCWPRHWQKWEMRDVEHTLCEFDKYERTKMGEGRPRGVYR